MQFSCLVSEKCSGYYVFGGWTDNLYSFFGFQADLRKMTRLVKMSECELFKLLNRGDALNKAYATVRLIDSVMSALRGHRNVSEIVLSRTGLVPNVDYFSLPVLLGPKGIAHRFPIPTLTERENILLEHAIKCIQVDKQKAIDLISRRARSNQCQTPEKAKEYSDLLDCDKKRIFVGAFLDKLKINKETCKPKLEYTLMSKNNDLVYPPDTEPSLTPKRIQFVEPDQVPSDGCCPVKLPCPPSPPKRGLTVIAPKKSKCKVVVSPCPYPPVVKLPKTCNTCGKGNPCEHYEGCKSLYGDSKCCDKTLPQPDNKSISTSTSEQPEIQQAPSGCQHTAGVSDQIQANQQINSCVETPQDSPPGNLQYSKLPQSNISEVPKITNLDSSMPLVTPNSSGEVKSVGTYPQNASETHCPYGMSQFGYNSTPPPVLENNSEETTFQTNHSVANESASQSHTASSPRHVDFTRLHSYSVPVESPVHQNTPHSQEIFIEPGEKDCNPDTTKSSLHSTYSKANCHEFIPKNLERSIDQCLSSKCLVEGKSGERSFPPLENNLRTTAIDHANVAGSALQFSDLKTPDQNPETPAPPQANHIQNKTESYSAALTAATNTKVQDTSNHSIQQARKNSSSATFNYSGGLGISSNKTQSDPNNAHLCFNRWSSHREEQYLATDAKPQKKKNVSMAVAGTVKLNEKQACETPKPKVIKNMEHESRTLQETKFDKDSSTQNTLSNIPVTAQSESVTDILNNYRITLTDKERNDLTMPTTDPILCKDEVRDWRSESKIINKEMPDATGTIADVPNMRMREHIRAHIKTVKMQESDQIKADKTKILGFGQIVRAFIPTTKLSKKTQEKSIKMTTPSRTQPQKLYVETHSNLPTDKPKVNNGSVVMLPIASSNDNKDSTMYRAEDDPSGLRRVDVDPEVTKMAHIRYRVQEALKNIILPQKYTQKPADKLARREKHVERILKEKMRRASKAVNKTVREVRRVDSAYAPVFQKLYAPKCPNSFLFASHPDSRVVTFNNVQKYDIPKRTKEKVRSAGSDVVDLHVKIGTAKEDETSDKSAAVGEEHVEKPNVTSSNEIHSKTADEHGSDDWSKPPKHKYLTPSLKSSQVAQNQLVPIRLKSSGQLKIARPTSNSEYLKQEVFPHRPSKEKRVEVNLVRLESTIKARSKKVLTPGSFRLARMNDPKYGLTSPNRTTSNR